MISSPSRAILTIITARPAACALHPRRLLPHCSDSRIGGQGAQALHAYLLFSSVTVVQIDGSLILDADFVPGQQQQQQQGAVDASAGKSAFAALLHDAEEEEEEDEDDDNRCSFFIVRR